MGFPTLLGTKWRGVTRMLVVAFLFGADYASAQDAGGCGVGSGKEATYQTVVEGYRPSSPATSA